MKIVNLIGLCFIGLHVQARDIDWPSFLQKSDMLWDQVPTTILKAPYLGNGMLGLTFYQEAAHPDNPEARTEKNVIALHVGRCDYYDNRPPEKGNANTWIYRGRLPIGFFRVRSKGDVTGVDWRLELWNARLVGTVRTTRGAYQVEGLVHSLYDSFYFKVTPSPDEEVNFEWQPQEAYSSTRRIAERNVARAKAAGREPARFDISFSSGEYPKAPEAELGKIMEQESGFCRQRLYADSGELVTAWKVIEDASSRARTLCGTIMFSTRMGISMPRAQKNLGRALNELRSGTYLRTHQEWWHDYYPRSFVSIADDFWEQFYWIQMYKFGSATRGNGTLIDVMGPWYSATYHPLVWSDLDVQIAYWPSLTANRLDVGASVVNKFDENIQNLVSNVPPDWRADCLNAGTVFPGDMTAPVGKGVSDHIVWLLHNYWLWCRYADDAARMRDGFFPLLKRATSVYLRYIKENPVALNDGKIHIKCSWSPEYPVGTGMDINYTLGLIRWACRTLLEIDRDHGLKDPKAPEWQNLLDHLADYPVDESGLRVGRDIPFDQAHRHYSHLLAFYPLFELTPDKDYALLKRSVDHWMNVTRDPARKKDTAMNLCPYTCSGAASMYAALGEGDRCLEYLRLVPFTSVSSTTLYTEGTEQIIDPPLSVAASIHDMLLQSWDGRIRVLPAVPLEWKDVHYKNLLAQGGLLVSAERREGINRFAIIESPRANRKVEFKVPLSDPRFFVRERTGRLVPVKLAQNSQGFHEAQVAPGEAIVALKEGEALEEVQPVKSQGTPNIFGYNGRYDVRVKEFQCDASEMGPK